MGKGNKKNNQPENDEGYLKEKNRKKHQNAKNVRYNDYYEPVNKDKKMSFDKFYQQAIKEWEAFGFQYQNDPPTKEECRQEYEKMYT